MACILTASFVLQQLELQPVSHMSEPKKDYEIKQQQKEDNMKNRACAQSSIIGCIFGCEAVCSTFYSTTCSSPIHCRLRSGPASGWYTSGNKLSRSLAYKSNSSAAMRTW